MNALTSVSSESAASRTIRTLEYLLQKHAYLLDEHGDHAPLTKAEPEVPVRKLSDQDKEKIISLFNNSVPPIEIAKQVNFSCAAITGFLQRAGLRQRKTHKSAT